ncbi:MAG: hypothetical protein GTN93_09835, partial [Anaerolineae bacterium]|nr:hypothetical protein [Anaerolineae bacterium]
MKHTPITPLVATFGAPIAMIGLLFLAACSATPTPVAVSDPATPNSTREIIATSASEGDEGLESVSPTPEPLPAKPTPTQTIPVTAPVAVSPLPSPTLAADGASPTVAEVVSGG